MLLIALVLATASIIAPRPAPGEPTSTRRTETAALCGVRAEIDIDAFTSLRIWRNGQLLVDAPIAILRSDLYSGPFWVDLRADHIGEPYLRLEVEPTTRAGRKRYPNGLDLTYRFDQKLGRYVSSLEKARWNDPLPVGSVKITDVTRAANLTITTSYELKNNRVVSAPRVGIVRHRVAVPVSPLSPGEIGPLSPPAVVNLAGDNEPEIDYGLGFAGTNCCAAEAIYRFDDSKRRYIETVQFWGFYRDAASLRDLDHDGKMEFVTRDEGLTGQFTAECCSGPGVIQVGRFEHDRIHWITRNYPALVRADALRAWRAVRSTKDPNVQPAEIAWYLADKLMLDEGAGGWANARAAYSGSNWRALARQLRSALQADGYSATGTKQRPVE